jgi:hypothetical protein
VFSQIYKFCLNNNIVVEKDGYITKEGERYAGAHVFTPVPGIYKNVVSFDFCLSGNTLVSMSNGTSKRIDELTNNNMVLGFDKTNKGLQNFSSINGLQKKGFKETVKIFLQDGKSIVCTPDHKFMLENGEWCRADELKNKYVKAGIEHTEDIKCELEKSWKLELEDMTFTMDSYENREKSLAFARMLGYIISDGSIYVTNKSEGYCKYCKKKLSQINSLKRHYKSKTCQSNQSNYLSDKEEDNIVLNIKQRKCVEVVFGTKIDAENFKNDVILFTKTEFKRLVNLPEPEEGTYYIVNRISMDYVPFKREDVLTQFF